MVIWPYVSLTLLACALVVSIPPLPMLPYPKRSLAVPHTEEPHFEGHDLVILLLLSAIALRSALWTSLQFLWAEESTILVALAAMAAIGKILGGALADKAGWKLWAVGALFVAAPLTFLWQAYPGALVVGVGLLQSATPVMVAAMGHAMPKFPATASGLALGLGLAIGGIVSLVGLEGLTSSPLSMAVVAMASGGLLWWGLRILD